MRTKPEGSCVALSGAAALSVFQDNKHPPCQHSHKTTHTQERPVNVNKHTHIQVTVS